MEFIGAIASMVDDVASMAVTPIARTAAVAGSQVTTMPGTVSSLHGSIMEEAKLVKLYGELTAELAELSRSIDRMQRTLVRMYGGIDDAWGEIEESKISFRPIPSEIVSSITTVESPTGV